jgi:hypothetical protein
MIEHTLDTEHAVLYLHPTSALQQQDFVELAKDVDPYIEKTGNLAGVVIEAKTFPGWDSFGAMAAHFRFVREHHKRIKKIAVVTDSALGNVVPKLASHFVAAQIKHFHSNEAEAAKQWVTTA